ncbi:LPS assembly lipoprotein LptE [Akkermansiaceae bacterium]|nr:LPS assembly lipoprotein LptE [Akkermansiaceae bacterium]
MIKYLTLLLCICFTSCAGYQLSGAKPTHLGHVKSIHVPLFKNRTLLTRAESYATNSALDALTRDGTYTMASASHADAVLKGSVSKVNFGRVSASRDDRQTTEELSMTITISWQLLDQANSLAVLEQGQSTGRTRFFAGDNLHVARTNALPDALRRASEAMTSRLADGF